MKKIFSLALVLFAALLFTNTSASAQSYYGPRLHVGVAIGGYYAPQVAIAPNYVCDYDEYNQPFNCQPEYPNQGYYVNSCGYDYACGGYYGGAYYGGYRDYRYDRRDGRDYGYRGGAPRGGYPVQPRGFAGRGGGVLQGGGIHGGGGSHAGSHR